MPSFADIKAETPEVEMLEEKINVMDLTDEQPTAFQKENIAIDKLNKQIAAKPRTANAKCINVGCKTRIITSRFTPGKQMACIDCRCVNWPTSSAQRCRMIRRTNEITGKPEEFCSTCANDPATQRQIDSEDESDEEFEEEESFESEDSEEEDEMAEADDGIVSRGQMLRDDVRGTPLEVLQGQRY